jgi:hypothetical protein
VQRLTRTGYTEGVFLRVLARRILRPRFSTLT